MARNTLPSTKQTPAQATAEKPSRLYFIDHLRAALVILVVLRTSSMTWAASGVVAEGPPRSTD